MSLSHSCLEGPLDILVPLTQLIVWRILWTSWNPPFMSLRHRSHAVWRIPWTSRDPPLLSPQTQAPMLSGESLGHPRILPWCPPGSSLSVPSDTEAPVLSGGSLGHPRILPWCPPRYRPPCCPEDPLDIPGSSLGVRPDTGPPAVRRIPWTSRDPPLVSAQTQAPLLSGGSLGHPRILLWCPPRHRPPCCPEDPLDIPGSSFGFR